MAYVVPNISENNWGAGMGGIKQIGHFTGPATWVLICAVEQGPTVMSCCHFLKSHNNYFFWTWDLQLKSSETTEHSRVEVCSVCVSTVPCLPVSTNSDGLNVWASLSLSTSWACYVYNWVGGGADSSKGPCFPWEPEHALNTEKTTTMF